MDKSKKYLIFILTALVFSGSLVFIKTIEDKGDSVVVFRNEYCEFCTPSDVTFQIIYQNGNFNNNKKSVKFGEEVSRVIHPAGNTNFSVSVYLPDGKLKTIEDGYATELGGSINKFVLTSEGEIVLMNRLTK